MTRYDKQDKFCLCLRCAHHLKSSTRCECISHFAHFITERGQEKERKMCKLKLGMLPCDTIKQCIKFKEEQ